MADEITIGSGVLLFRIVRAAWKGVVFLINDPYMALRHIQRHKWWDLSWDFRGFLGMSAEGVGPVYVSCVQVFGINKSNKGVRNISGHIRSNITGQQLPLTMEGMRPEDTNGIPSKCKFFIQALFRDPTSKREGIIEDRFLKEWSDFTFVFKADEKKYKFRFRAGEVTRSISRFTKPLKRAPEPLITRRSKE
jgi:hypothetical protein